jgi:hypothetical protein
MVIFGRSDVRVDGEAHSLKAVPPELKNRAG